MKKTLTTALCALLVTATASAQSIYFENLYKDFQDTDDAVTVSITGNLLTLASWFADEVEDREVMEELGRSIDMVKMVVLENDLRLSDRDLDEFKAKITGKEGFEELMVMRDGDQVVDVWAIEAEGVMKEIIMVMVEDGQMVVMDLWGEIDLKNVHTLVKAMDDM